LVSGEAPSLDDEIVVSEGAAGIGQQVTVLTASSKHTYTVSGLVKRVTFESALFFTDKEAARLSPRIDALATHTNGATARQTVGNSAEVLTGADRRRVDPDLKNYRQALNSTGIVAAMAAGLAVFVSTFVIASTFAFSVAQRLRELALFRLVGATPKQVRRMIYIEALVVGVVASGLGSIAGWLGAPFVAHVLIALHLAPEGFELGSALWPPLVAFAIGLSVALLGVRAAARRASRIRAIAALREAAIERG
jgi:putative ABC transport system permease protein